jgi:hypothetical protein
MRKLVMISCYVNGKRLTVFKWVMPGEDGKIRANYEKEFQIPTGKTFSPT